MAAEVLLGSERRVLIGGYGLPAPPPPPPAESLLGRLDQIDLRLRQLEEQRRPSSAADDDGGGGGGWCSVPGAPRRARHRHSKSMPSALQEDQQALLRGTLMDRLNLLESRIRQLSCELDGGGGGAAAAVSSVVPVPRPAEDRAWSESPVPEPPHPPTAGSWGAVQILQRGARQLHRGKPTTPTKAKTKTKTKQELEEAGRCGREEKETKKRGGRGAAAATAAGRRWFTVGC